jgi:MFS family permease
MADPLIAAPASVALVAAGPLEAQHLGSRFYRNVAGTGRVTATHWHIAWANGLGWGFDGMDGAILALVAPLLMRDFAIDLPTYRNGVQISALISIVGLYLWPWLADRFGRRNILAINIAVFSLAMPLVAISPGWGAFVAAYTVVRFALNGEWAVGSMLVAETWPARLRGLVLSFDRSAWGIGAALAGTIATFVVTVWGWRAAFVGPTIIALLAIYVRLLCPESPYWVRTQDRKQRIAERLSANLPLSDEDSDWIDKTRKPGWRQLFLPDLRRNTIMATFVASLALVSYSTVGLWMPLFLAQQHHWTTAQYGTFYISWALFATTGFWAGGWMIDRFGRRLGFAVLLLEAAVFVTIHKHVGDMAARHGVVLGVHRRVGTGDDLHGRDVPDPNPWRRQRLLLGRCVPHRRGVLAVRLGLAAPDHRIVRRGVSADPGDPCHHGGDHLVLQPGARPQGPRPDRSVRGESQCVPGSITHEGGMSARRGSVSATCVRST